MKHDVILPEKDFFNIHFLPEREIFQMTFDRQNYMIIAKDDVGNFIGIAPDKQIIFLDTMYEGDEQGLIYIAKDIETFLKEIQLYQQYGETPYPDHPSKDFLETYETNFRELISSLDADAFCSENTFWSTAAEEMGYGII